MGGVEWDKWGRVGWVEQSGKMMMKTTMTMLMFSNKNKIKCKNDRY